MKIVTWNVNSIRARHDRVLEWLEKTRPEVLCLQELKVEDGKFDWGPYEALGYQVAAHGQRTYNGVAILASSPLSDVERGFGDAVEDPQARFIAATVEGVRVMSAYIPNGESVTSDKYQYKLQWLERLRRYLAARVIPEQPVALCGDFNIAPASIDVYDPVGWAESVLCSTPEREALARVCEVGFIDLVRRMHPEEPMYSWWDYRMLAFPKNQGLRIDHILATPALAARAVDARVDRDARKGKQPSDHAPVWAEFTAP